MNTKQIIAVGIFAFLMFILIVSISGVLNPPKADYDDVLFEAIGGDEFLNVTLKPALKVHEEKIPDGSFNISTGEMKYYDAKNITYVDSFGVKDYFIVWKTSPDNYDWIYDKNINIYISDYLTSGDGKCFVEYSYEDEYVYGVMVDTQNKDISESKLIYDILGLNRTGFDLVYSSTSSNHPTYSGSYSSGGNHYHTVVPDRYTLSRTDPGAYYDHYEYGDNYDIDDYLESEGFD